MSDRKLNLTVKFGGVDNLTGVLKSIAGTSTTAQRNLRGLGQESSRLKRELKDVRGALAGATGNVSHLVDRERQLEQQLASTNHRLEQQKGALARISKARALADSARSAGQNNLVAGATLAAPLLLAGKAASDFEQTMIDIGQKGDLSARQIGNMQKGMFAVARETAQLPDKIAAGVDALAGFGMDPSQATKMIAPIGRAATAYNAEVTDLSAATYASIDNLNVPIGQTAKTLDIMAAAGKSGAFELKDMAQYFPALTASAAALGQKGTGAVADLAAALQITRKGAGDSASAANNLENLLNKINTEDTIKNFKEFGVDLPAAMKKAAQDGKSPIEAIAELTKKATGGDLSKLSFLFGDAQVQAALRPLIQNMGLYRQIRDQAGRATGTVNKDFQQRAGVAAANTNKLMGSLTHIAIVVGSQLLPPFVAIAGKVENLANRFADWAEANPTLARYLTLTVAAVASLSIGLGAARIAFSYLIGPAFRLINMFGLLRTASMFLARGVVRAGMMMLANPIVLAITAVVVAVGVAAYLIYKHWDTIKAAFWKGVAALNAAWDWIKSGFQSGMTWLGGLPGRFLAFGENIVQGLIDGFKARVAAVKNLVVGFANNVSGWFKSALGIHSPSRVFMGLGGHISDGLNIGLDRGMTDTARRMKTMARGVAMAASVGAAPVAASSGLTHSAAMRPGPAVTIGSITIQIHAQPGQNTEDIAKAVEARLREISDRQAASARSDYRDHD